MAALAILVALAVAALAILVTLSVAALAILVALAVAALALMAVALMLLLRKVLSVQTLLKLFLRGLPDAHHLAGEIEGLAGHRMVEVHHDGVSLYLVDGSLNDLAGVAEHRDDLADDEKILADLAVDLERGLRQLDQAAVVECAVAFLGGEGERELLSWLLALYLALEFRKKHMCSVNVVKRALLRRLVGEFSIDNQFVGQLDHMVFLYFHDDNLFIINLLPMLLRLRSRKSGAEVHVSER